MYLRQLNRLIMIKWPFLTIAKLSLAFVVIYFLTSLPKELHHFRKLVPAAFGLHDRGGHQSSSSHPSGQDGNQLSTSSRRQTFAVGDGVTVTRQEANCGLATSCPSEQFAVHIYSGLENRDHPRMCIDGNHVLNPKSSYRGITLAVIDNVSKTVLRVAHHDTYEHDSTPLERDLLTVRQGDIVVLVTHDEASTRLSTVARLLLHELGSGNAQNIQYRASWYLVSQKGLEGYSPFEGLSLPGPGGWGQPQNFRACVPVHITGVAVQPDATVVENKPRKQFCERYGELWPDFCANHVVNEQLITSGTLRALPISVDLLRTPIIVVTRGPSSTLPLTLETIIRQPGIRQKNILVFYDKDKAAVITPLVDLFGFMSEEFAGHEPLTDAIETTELLFPDAKQFILVDADVLLSPDFLTFMGQAIPVLHAPGSGLIGVSAWNENGLSTLSSDDKAVLRGDASRYRPRFAAMFKREVKLDFSELSSSTRWSFGDSTIVSGPLLVPEVSRVYFVPRVDAEPLTEVEGTFLTTYLSCPRSVAMDEEVQLRGLEHVVSSAAYERHIMELAKSAIQFDEDTNAIEFVKNQVAQTVLIRCSLRTCTSICEHFALPICEPQVYSPTLSAGVQIVALKSGSHVVVVSDL